MLMKMAITQLLMGLFEKLFHLNITQTPLYQEKFSILYLPKSPD